MSATDKTHELGHEDRKLVDLVKAALVDPDINTDLRMRLHNEIGDLLETTHPHLHTHRKVHEESRPEESRLPEHLKAALVDPDVHTDTRMRLHNEIPELLRSARHDSTVMARHAQHSASTHAGVGIGSR